MAKLIDRYPRTCLALLIITWYCWYYEYAEIETKREISEQYEPNSLCTMFFASRTVESIQECYDAVGVKK